MLLYRILHRKRADAEAGTEAQQAFPAIALHAPLVHLLDFLTLGPFHAIKHDIRSCLTAPALFMLVAVFDFYSTNRPITLTSVAAGCPGPHRCGDVPGDYPSCVPPPTPSIKTTTAKHSLRSGLRRLCPRRGSCGTCAVEDAQGNCRWRPRLARHVQTGPKRCQRRSWKN